MNIKVLFILQCCTPASKPEPLKQDTKKKRKRNKLLLNDKIIKN